MPHHQKHHPKVGSFQPLSKHEVAFVFIFGLTDLILCISPRLSTLKVAKCVQRTLANRSSSSSSSSKRHLRSSAQLKSTFRSSSAQRISPGKKLTANERAAASCAASSEQRAVWLHSRRGATTASELLRGLQIFRRCCRRQRRRRRRRRRRAFLLLLGWLVRSLAGRGFQAHDENENAACKRQQQQQQQQHQQHQQQH